MQYATELVTTIHDILQKGRAVLAIDESSPTIAKRFKAIDVELTEESRRAWRSLLVTTQDLGLYISGTIMFEQTLGQKTDAEKILPGAVACQQEGLVPIVEPEVLMDGNHDIERHAQVTRVSLLRRKTKNSKCYFLS